MRRIISAVLALSLVLALVGCEPSARTPEEYCELGVRYLTDGNYEEAVIAFTSALEIDPRYVEALSGRGTALQNLGGEENLQGAREDFQAALDLDDSSLDTWLALFDVLYELGEEDEARDLLADAYSRFGETPELSRRVDQLEENGELEDEDLALFGREPAAARNTADFEPVQLSQTDTDEILRLLEGTCGMSTGISTYDCTDPSAEERAIDFTVMPYHNLFYIYFPDGVVRDYWDEIYQDNITSYQNGNFGPQDPLGVIPLDYTSNCYVYSGDSIDWLLRNVYNVEPTHPPSPVTITLSDFSNMPQLCYYYDGDYYTQQPYGIGDEPTFEIWTLQNSVSSQSYLYVNYHIDYDPKYFTPVVPDPIDLYALLKQNEVDGRYVWSLCYMNLQPLDDISRFIDL